MTPARWPPTVDPSACRAAALDPAAAGDPLLAAAAKKITGGLASSEKALLAVPAYAGAVAARVALECALAEGARLFAEAPEVDAAGVDALARSSSAAAGALRAAEEEARLGRQLDRLQLFASASAALHRELQAVTDLAARLRAAKAVPRTVALDPGAPEPAAPPPSPAPPRLRLSEFAGFDGSPARWRRLALLGALVALFLAATARALFFAGPRVDQLEAAASGPGVAAVRVSGPSAAVTVRQRGWVPSPPLLQALRARNVKSAAVLLESGAGVGQLDVKTGRLYGPPAPDAGAR